MKRENEVLTNGSIVIGLREEEHKVEDKEAEKPVKKTAKKK